MLYKSAAFGMAGCCDGRDTQNCGWASSCIDKKSVDAGNCGTNCQLNTFIRKCTDATAPYCVTWTYPSNNIADYGCESTSSKTVFTVRQTATDDVGDTTSTSLPTVAAAGITFPTGSSNNSTSYRTVKKLAIGTIIGIVIAVLALIFFAIVGVCVILKKRKKSKQLAQNAQIVASAQANRPQSQFNPAPPPPPQQQMQVQQPPPPMPSQSPQPTINGYFSPPGQQDQKYGHTSVTEYAMTPISNPSTPAPAYAQPYVYQNQTTPPIPQQQSGQYQPPANGAHEVASPVQQQNTFTNANMNPQAHEVDATSVPHAPGNGKPVYEMGGR